MHNTATSKLTFALSFLGLAVCALPGYAAAAPGIQIHDDVGRIITIDSTGAVAYSGTCTGATCTTTASTGMQNTVGTVSWAGTIGNFTFTATGQTAPLRQGIQDINVSSLFTGAAGGTLTVLFSVNNIDGSGPYTLNQTTSFLAGTGTATYTSFADPTNTPFNTSPLLAVGSFPPIVSTLTGSLAGLAGPSSHLMSVTDQVVLTVGGGAFFSTDFYTMNSSNPSLAVSCASGSGVAGVGYNGTLAASGGVPSYLFSLVGSLPPGLTLNPTSGAITGTPSAEGSFPYTAQVADSSGSSSSQSITSGCSITINPPATPLSLVCATSGGEVGAPYNSNLVAMGGTGKGYMYSIASGSLPAPLTLNPTTGFISGTPTGAGAFAFTAKVTDTGDSTEAPVSSSCSITTVTAPSSTCVSISATQGVGISSVTLTATGGAGGPYTFTATGLPSGLSISSGGTISGVPNASGTFPYTVTITDKNGNKGTMNCSVTVNPPVVLTCITIIATQGTAIAPVTLSGGSGNVFSATGLPAGLSISSAGTISGTPTVNGTFSYTVTVKDGSGNVLATMKCSVTVNPAIAPLSLLCAGGTATVGTPYTSTLAVTGGLAPYTFSISAGTLPGGLTLNSSTGAITGTPTGAGTFGYTAKVVDSKGSVAYSSCNGSCGVGAPLSWNLVSKLGNLGNSYSWTSGGVTLTAYGFNNNGTPTALYAKNQSSSEMGLGIASDSDFEINTSTFVQLDVSQLVAAGVTNAQISFDSVQSGESWNVYGSNTLGSLGTLLSAKGTSQNSLIAMPGYGTYRYIGIRAGAVNIDIAAVASTMPTTCSITVAPAAAVSHGDAATIGFWQNKNGQAIITSLNGGPTSTALSVWLQAQFPNTCGSVGNMTNTQIASLYDLIFSQDKTLAQIMATALATYVTSTNLGGTDPTITSLRSKYGFNSSPGGTGAKSYNVGSNGSAIGLSNNVSYTVAQLLHQVELTMQNGTYNDNAFNTIFNGINTTGDIN